MQEIDVRWLPQPEPFEKITRTLQMLPAEETLQVLIHREPFPLYEALQANGYKWQTMPLEDGCFKILIARAA